jgi:hypothetical protein
MGEVVKKVSARLAARRRVADDSACGPMEALEMSPPATLPNPPEGGGEQVGNAAILDLKSLAELSVDELKDMFTDLKSREQELEQALEQTDIEAFVDAFNEMGQELQRKVSSIVGVNGMIRDLDTILASIKAASNWTSNGRLDALETALDRLASTSVVRTDLLIRVAHNHPETRKVLLPIIVAAKKGKKKSKSKKKGKGKAPPFGGKGAPPFGKKDGGKDEDKGKKKSPPKKKGKSKSKKASVDITSDDLKW